MKLLFIQLPLLDHSLAYISGNIEYAPGAIAGYLRRQFQDRATVEILPRLLANFASNNVISNYIRHKKPDLVCFTGYLWNIERNLNIASAIKANSTMKIIMGGPEITEDSWVLDKKQNDVDIFVQGEGEWFFAEYFANPDYKRYSSEINGNLLIKQPDKQLTPVNDIIEPFTNNILEPMPDGSIFLELTRGCPYRCSYCFYSKNAASVRELPFQTLLDALEMPQSVNLNEIYILAPTFNKSAHFINNLKALAEHNQDIRLHTEMRTHNIDASRAALIYQAGFRSLEVGLQTLNKNALKKAMRKSDPEKELQGMIELQKAGIDLKIGIIPGLPDDSPDDFIHTIDRLIDLGFEDNIEFYPLMLLPGTKIKDLALKDGVQFQQLPPYYIIDGWNFDHDSIMNILAYMEKKTGYVHSYKKLPNFIITDEGDLTGGVSFNGDSISNWHGQNYSAFIDTSIFNFYISLTKISLIEQGLRALFPDLSQSDELFNLILSTNQLIDEEIIINFLIANDHDNLFRRIHFYEGWEKGQRIQFYQTFSNIDQYMLAESSYYFIEPVFKVTRTNAGILSSGQVEIRNILIAHDVIHSIEDFVKQHYSEDSECISFENEQDQMHYYRLTNQEYSRLPYSFKTMKF